LSADATTTGPLPAPEEERGFRSRRLFANQFRDARVAWAGCTLLLVALWAAIALVGLQLADMRQREREAEVVSTAKGFSEYVGLHLHFVDRMLQSARDSYLDTGTIPPHSVLTRDLGSIAPLLLHISVSDAQGQLVASSLQFHPGVNISDRAHFLVFRNDPRDRLYVSEPVVGRVSGKMSLQLARPLLGPAGEFQGVVIAGIDPEKLQQYFASVDAFARSGTVLIVGRSDGVVRARFEKSRITWGQSLLGSPYWRTLSGESRGSYAVEASLIDGVKRLVGFHKVTDYPLVVAVTSMGPSISLGEVCMGIAVGLAITVALLTYVRTRLRHEHDQALVIEQLTQSREREAEANRMKSSFVASISHELRTPLNSILGFSELLRDMPDHPENAGRAGLIHSSGQHLHSLLNTLLDLAKIEAGRMEIHRTEIDLADTVRTICEMHRASATAKGLSMDLEFTLPPGRSVFAHTDLTKYVQVLNNVVNNAVKFTAQGGIRLAAYLEGSEFVVKVSDTGSGIRAEHLPYVFDRFSSASTAGTRHEAGTGLGLSLSSELMGLMGGSIHLSSVAGCGTDVFIRLPDVELRAISS